MASSTPAPRFTPGQLEQLSRVLGHTTDGLTGQEIAHALAKAKITDIDSTSTKWKRIYSALAIRQNQDQTGGCVLNFIHHALEPARYLSRTKVFEIRRGHVNEVLAFQGLLFNSEGKFQRVSRAKTLDDATRRAGQLRQKLTDRGVHPDVLTFCRAELLVDNYFHAALEAVKSINAKIKVRTGLDLDGSDLYDAALGGSAPRLHINTLQNKSQRSEQSGFLNLLKGLHGMFRNPTAHEPRTAWPMPEEDALDLLAAISYVHRRLDKAH
ncbi:MAG: TIGR02391 family protein [Deltaproteobacteria bacterium]|nr:TIGR02391 family protein [Deltaproteobacteria bacterium]